LEGVIAKLAAKRATKRATPAQFHSIPEFGTGSLA
jgi:hypothetical protein